MCPDKNSSPYLTRSKVVEEAKTWINVPFLHQGGSRKGIDCVHLLKEICRGVGAEDPTPDIHNYSCRPEVQDSLLRYLDGNLVKIRNGEVKPARIVAVKDSMFPYHVGIISTKYGTDSMIHASLSRGKVVEDLWVEMGWKKKVIAVYEFPCIEREQAL